MSNVEADIHSALMAKAESITGYDVLWPQKGGDKPAGEYLSVYHLPNDNTPAGIDGNVYERKGFLIITLVSPLGQYEAKTKKVVGDIAAIFGRGRLPALNATVVTIDSISIKPGRQENNRWETPIWFSYRTIA